MTQTKSYFEARKERTLNYYVESGILALIAELLCKGFSQEDIAGFLAENGYETSGGICHWTQANVSKIIKRARENGVWPNITQ